MGNLVRFGVSLDEALLTRFDGLCARQGYPSRSEALRDMIRESLLKETWSETSGPAAAVLTLVYDHHVRDLSAKLTKAQHAAHDLIVTTQHLHLDHHHCLEILVLRGPAPRLQALAESLRAIRGVTHGDFAIMPAGASDVV